MLPSDIALTQEELRRAKRATVVLAECFKVANGGKQTPLELRKDMLALTKCLRALEPLAKEKETFNERE